MEVWKGPKCTDLIIDTKVAVKITKDEHTLEEAEHNVYLKLEYACKNICHICKTL